MAVPLILSSQTFGMIYVDNPYDSRFTEDDLQVLTTIAGVASIKIENAKLAEERLEGRRLQEELKVASEIQMRLQPACPPPIDGYATLRLQHSVARDRRRLLRLHRAQETAPLRARAWRRLGQGDRRGAADELAARGRARAGPDRAPDPRDDGAPERLHRRELAREQVSDALLL